MKHSAKPHTPSYKNQDESQESYEILLENLVIHTIIGILPSERTVPQRLAITLHATYRIPQSQPTLKALTTNPINPATIEQTSALECDTAGNGKNTQTSDRFLDYALMRDMLVAHLQDSGYGLLEEALDGAITMLKATFPAITHITLTLKKPDILAPCCVGVRKSVAF